jgi:hypothetical protein
MERFGPGEADMMLMEDVLWKLGYGSLLNARP